MRQPRDERRRGVRVTLSERDQALLAALARFRVARTSDLVRYAFSGTRRDTAARRLRRLYDARYLDVRSGNRAEESLYTLGRAGRAFVADRAASPGRVPRAGLAHHLAVVAAWIDLALAAAETGLALARFVPEWEIRESRDAAGMAVVPDGLFQLHGTGSDGASWVVRVALEADRATERLSVLGRKLRAYEEVAEASSGLFGWRDFCLAVAVPGANRLRADRLDALLGGSALPAWWTWTSYGELVGTFRQLSSHPEPPLTPSPYSKGSGRAVTGRKL